MYHLLPIRGLYPTYHLLRKLRNSNDLSRISFARRSFITCPCPSFPDDFVQLPAEQPLITSLYGWLKSPYKILSGRHFIFYINRKSFPDSGSFFGHLTQLKSTGLVSGDSPCLDPRYPNMVVSIFTPSHVFGGKMAGFSQGGSKWRLVKMDIHAVLGCPVWS